MRKKTPTIITMTLALMLTGCGFSGTPEITSSPPGATIYSYQASGRQPWPATFPHWYRHNKPTPEQMRYAHRSSRPILTPHTFGGGPFSHWYQVRKEGLATDDIAVFYVEFCRCLLQKNLGPLGRCVSPENGIGDCRRSSLLAAKPAAVTGC